VILNKREKMIAYVTGAAIGLFALDYVAIGPLMAHRASLVTGIDAATREQNIADQVIDRGRVMDRRWNEMVQAGLKTDLSATEAQALHALRDWAQESGLGLTSLKPERTERVKQLNQITIRATAQGNLRSVGRFLYHIQTADIPIRVTDMQIAARKEGTDDLTLQLGVSTVAQAPPEKAKPGVRAAAPPTAGGAR
jgi:hypothetical protein